jgi:glycosyltransferase involved in cell wall biosynthesis
MGAVARREASPAQVNGRARHHSEVAESRVRYTFRVWPAYSGGQQRMLNIYAQLAHRADVTLVSFDYSAERITTVELGKNFRQVVTPTTPEHLTHDLALSATLGGASVTDIAAIEIEKFSPKFCQTLAKALVGADLAIAEHPYCFNAIHRAWRGPLVYHAYNVEAQLKATILPPDESGIVALQKVADVESACCRAADLVLVVSERDRSEMARRYAIAPEKIIVVPNGANMPLKPVLDRDERLANAARLGLAGPTAVYVGSQHGPNIEGALATFEIACGNPAWLFLLVGSMCNSSIVRGTVLPPNVLLLVELTRAELLTVMAAADVGLNPIETGGGTNLKMLDYAANGLVVVTTPFGNRGIAFRHGEECIVSPLHDVAEALDKISRADSLELAQIARQGFEYVLQNFTWAKIVDGVTLLGIAPLQP